ncbi:MAG: TonB-dependent receptor [Bacteroidales bacterium]|nr:TonB-dependent receptor [Bacteroidales bacterium]
MKQKILILLLAISPLLGLYAQTGTVSGRVTDSQSGKTLPAVTVKVGTQQTFTDNEGLFSLPGISPGDAVIELSAAGYQTLTQQISVTAATNLGTLKMLATVASEAINDGMSEVSIASIDSDDDSKGQSISGLLTSSSDVFESVASYTFGPAYFRMRGYDNDLNVTYIGNTPISDVETGRTTWALWGGLNDATRNKVSVNGLAPASFSFGSLGGATNIITRASQHRAQTKLTYSLSNRSYTNRLMFTHSTGMMDNNWAVTVSGSRRWGNGGYIEGTYYDAWAWFLGVERKINDKHSLAFTAFAAPVKRGMQGGSTQEVYDLSGTNYYNPNWGYQDGKVRNARERIMNQPVLILNHYWKPSEKTQITSAVSYLFGETGTTSLNWYNSTDPRPDYYRYLPSYYPETLLDEGGFTYDPSIAAAYAERWKNDVNTRQINWDRLYQVNYLANLEGKQARYIIENRHNDQSQLNFTSFMNHEFSEKLRFDGGLEYNANTGTFYKTLHDLLGSEYWIDVDQFAERDFSGNDTLLQNDLNNPNRIIKEGDKFGYDYKLHQNSGNIWGVANYSTRKVDYYAGLQLTHTTIWREGFMRNGRYPDNSFGDGEKYTFFDYAVKAGATYKISGRHFVEANAVMMTRATSIRNAFLSSRIRDAVIPDLNSENIMGGDISYHLRTPLVKGRITLYHTVMTDLNEVSSFYHDTYNTFVNYAILDFSKVHQGIEFGAEVKLSPRFTLPLVASIGNFRFTNNPMVNVSYENGSQADLQYRTYQNYMYVPGTPQKAYSGGLKFAGPDMLFIEFNVNYFDDVYLDFNTERRTSEIVSQVAGIGESPELMAEIVNQTKTDAAFTMDASVGKSFRVMDKYYINLNFSVSNLLNNQDFITGGYESNRFDPEKPNLSLGNTFVPKVYYYYGRTFFLNVGFRF